MELVFNDRIRLHVVGVFVCFSMHKQIAIAVGDSLKLECDKLASEKSEMQRHYIMVSGCFYFQPGHSASNADSVLTALTVKLSSCHIMWLHCHQHPTVFPGVFHSTMRCPTG